jgi:hypothetical protein
MKNSAIVDVLLRTKWALAVVSIGAAVAVSGAGLKWGGMTA